MASRVPVSATGSQATASTPPATDDQQGSPDSQEPPTAKMTTRLRLIGVVVVLWGIIVAVMVLSAANPVALSRPQIAKADVIVTARRPDFRNSNLHVLQVWRGDLPAGDHAVLNLGQLSMSDMPPGVDFIVPLTHERGGLAITTLPLQDPKKPPLVYPVNDLTTRQLQDLLNQLTRPR